MAKQIFICALLFNIILCSASPQKQQSIEQKNVEWLNFRMPKVNDSSLPNALLIGDFVTEQYAGEVERQLEGKVNVMCLSTNRPMLGNDIVLNEILMLVHQYKFDIMHFYNDINDCSYSVDEFKKEFSKLFEAIKQNAPHAKYIWATAAPRWKIDGKQYADSLNERIIARNQIVRDYFKSIPDVEINDLASMVKRNSVFYGTGKDMCLNDMGIKVLANSVSDNILQAINSESKLIYFPNDYSPLEVGKKLGYHFVTSKHQLQKTYWIHYAEVCTWLGALRYAKTVNDKDLIHGLRNRFDVLINDEKQYLPIQNHVDLNMFGCLPLELYQITKDKNYYKLGLSYADSQWAVPDTLSAEGRAISKKGYTWQTRMWIDDMFMITILQAQAYRSTKDVKYLNRAAKEMAMYLNKLQQPNGLFFHAPDVPYYWARGNGWVAAGMVELLSLLPEKNPERKCILECYKKMMSSLKSYQCSDGMWNQLIDEQTFWPETSGSAMFTYAMVMGVKNGWLDAKEYTPIVRKAWLSLVDYINPNGDVREVCVGTGKQNDKQYYYDRPRVAGDYHGQAALLWCVYALLDK